MEDDEIEKLRAIRKQKISSNKQFESGDIGLSRNYEFKKETDEKIQANLRDIAEIERMLNAENVKFED